MLADLSAVFFGRIDPPPKIVRPEHHPRGIESMENSIQIFEAQAQNASQAATESLRDHGSAQPNIFQSDAAWHSEFAATNFIVSDHSRDPRCRLKNFVTADHACLSCSPLKP